MNTNLHISEEDGGLIIDKRNHFTRQHWLLWMAQCEDTISTWKKVELGQPLHLYRLARINLGENNETLMTSEIPNFSETFSEKALTTYYMASRTKWNTSENRTRHTVDVRWL